MNLSPYYPNEDELTEEQMQAAYAAIVAALSSAHPDVDFSPNTPTGDLVIAPEAQNRAVMEEVVRRILSDLDLENVANNIIYNCEFVEGFLGNYGVYDRVGMSGSGVLRLTFSTPDLREIDRGMKFIFESEEDVFYPNLIYDGPLYVLPPGVPADPGENAVAMTAVGLGAWVADIPLHGNVQSAPTRGDTAQIDREIPGLTAAVAAVDFTIGQAPASLPDLARLARQTVFSAAPGSRNAVRRSLFYAWPQSKIVAPILTGDAEMLQAETAGFLAMPTPALTVYYRSSGEMVQESATLAIPYVPGADKFIGPVDLPSFPSMVSSIVAASFPTRPLNEAILFTKSPNPAFPGVTAGHSPDSPLWVMLDPPRDDAGESIVPRVDHDGLVGLFTFTYYTDPVLPHVKAFFESGENSPLGVRTSVQAGPLIHLRSMKIYYERQAGTTMTLQDAREKIADFVNSVGYPSAWTDSKISEIMRYAGASLVRNIDIDHSVLHSPASRCLFIDSSFDDLNLGALNIAEAGEGYDDALQDILDAHSFPIPEDKTPFNEIFVGGEVVGPLGNSTYRAISPRIVRYFVTPESITFHELRS